MEQNVKLLIWAVIIITLPISIPLAIISAGMIFTVLWIILCLFLMNVKTVLISIAVVGVVYIVYKLLSRNG